MLKEFSKKETNRYELVIKVDAEKFGEAIKQAYLENGKKINVPGFRKGKAPMGLIEKYYGKKCCASKPYKHDNAENFLFLANE